MTVEDHDLEPTEQELKDAAALAEAMDQSESASASQRELAAVALMKFANQGPLDEVRLQRAQTNAWERARRKRRALMWMAPSVAFAAAAALLLLLTSPRAEAVLPAPDASLLRAQADAVRGDATSLDSAMKLYRRRMYTAMRNQYGDSR